MNLWIASFFERGIKANRSLCPHAPLRKGKYFSASEPPHSDNFDNFGLNMLLLILLVRNTKLWSVELINYE